MRWPTARTPVRTPIWLPVLTVLALVFGLSVLTAPAAMSAPADRIGICHLTGSETQQFIYIEVNENSWSAHAEHGDSLAPNGEADCTPPPPNTAPDAVDDTLETLEDTAATLNVLANDYDPDGVDILSVTAVDPVTVVGGTTTFLSDGTVTYTPPTGFFGSDSFTYTISDGYSGVDTATVSVTVTEAPVTCGDVSGTVRDASTGNVLSGAVVAVAGTSLSATSDSGGDFSIACVPAGTQTLATSATGYTSRTDSVEVVAGSTVTASIALVPLSSGGDITVVLTWGDSPSDLDSHLSGPDGSGGRFHLAYYDMNPVSHASLDVDDTTSYGPETVTITISSVDGAFVAGDYHFWIHNYSQSPEFDVSGATVTVSQSGAQLAQYSVAGASGHPANDLWHVVNLQVAADGSVTLAPVQTFLSGDESTEF